MRLAVWDRSSQHWSAGGVYARVQYQALCLALAEAAGSDEAVIITERDPDAFSLPGEPSLAVEAIPPFHDLPSGMGSRLFSLALGWSPLGTLYRNRRFTAWTGAHRIDVLFSFPPPAWWRPGGAAACAWLPDFQHCREPWRFSAAERMNRDCFFRRVAARCEIVLLSSRSAADDFAAFAPRHAAKARVYRFPSSYAFRSSLPLLRETMLPEGVEPGYLLVANQFWSHKNHLLVVEAAASLASEGRSCPQIVMIGKEEDYRDPSGSLAAQVRARVREAGLEGRVRLLGYVSEAVKDTLLRRCRALVQPSAFEGWNTSVEDAKALGRPVLASDIPVHREQVPEAFGFALPGAAGAWVELLACAASELPAEADEEGERASLRAARARAIEAGRSLLSIGREAVRMAEAHRMRR